MDPKPAAQASKGPNPLRDLLTVLIEEVSQQHEALAVTLRRIGDVTRQEVMSAGESMARIYEASARHAEELEILRRDETRGATGAFANELGKVLNEMPSKIRRLVLQAQSQADSATKAQEQVGNIRTLLATIDRIASDCRLIATNARIEAADAGSKGDSFSVVANDLKDVSKDAQDAARSIEALGQATVRILVGMASKAKRIVNDGQEEMESLSVSATRCRQAYADAVLDALGALGEHAEQIRDQSNRTITHLQFQDRIQQALEHATRQSAGVLNLLHRLSVDVGSKNQPLDIAAIRQLVRASRASLDPISAVTAPGGDGSVEFL